MPLEDKRACSGPSGPFCILAGHGPWTKRTMNKHERAILAAEVVRWRHANQASLSSTAKHFGISAPTVSRYWQGAGMQPLRVPQTVWRGADKKQRKRRTDNPARYLPSASEARAKALSSGKAVGRPPGSRNGVSRAERRLDTALAGAKARLEMRFWEAVGAWPTAEHRQRLYRSIDRALLEAAEAVRRRRAERKANGITKAPSR
ncbi:hypothetical protein LMG9964_03871 [Paraburkholderia phenoliruptrix]|uniref:Uncharacterized protein n=1 Tax=Paraburkholderia phenoliruptrix TaxID=252970 RepID=A0A6J5K8H8_9BURK|nr:hypothetical protein [Paraburkholderia phenoliruptrix]CAB4050206.1 hypothetical protein LMG9964_03871 [Paraburkholderia phenoliruptrix]